MGRKLGLTKKRKVTDILDLMGPVAFEQYEKAIVHGGNSLLVVGTEYVLAYRGVCPWCAKTLDDDVYGPTYGQLYDNLFEIQARHMRRCSRRDTPQDDMMVYVNE